MNGSQLRIPDAVERVALVAALLSLLGYGVDGSYEVPEQWHFGALAAAIAGLAAVFTHRAWAGGFTLIAALCVGLREHAIQGDHRASDVMLATNEAIGVLFSGGNPYQHVYLMTNPPGQPFGYPPGEIAFYSLAHLIGNNIFRVDLACGIIVLGIVAAFVPYCGTGITALGLSALGWSNDINFHLTDGSNDNAAALLVIAGFAALVWSASTPGRAGKALWWLSAVALGWAFAFKEYSAPIEFFIALYLWRKDPVRARHWLYALIGTAAFFTLPFLIWDPGALIHNVGGALITHTNIWGRNVWHDWVSFIPLSDMIAPLIPVLLLACIAVLVVVLWRHPARTFAEALLQGIAVVALTFVMARWTTVVYYVFLLPVSVSAIMLKLGAEVGSSEFEALP